MNETNDNAQIFKGLLDMLVLMVLVEGDNYGFGILQQVEGMIGSESGLLKDTTLYPLLHRLESKNFLQSYLKPGDRGTARKYYQITPLGNDFLKNRMSEWSKVLTLLEPILKRGKYATVRT